MTRSSLKDRLDTLAVSLHRAAQREQERTRLSQQDLADMASPLVGAGIFNVSGAMRERHQQMDEKQQEANDRISKDTTRF